MPYARSPRPDEASGRPGIPGPAMEIRDRSNGFAAGVSRARGRTSQVPHACPGPASLRNGNPPAHHIGTGGENPHWMKHRTGGHRKLPSALSRIQNHAALYGSFSVIGAGGHNVSIIAQRVEGPGRIRSQPGAAVDPGYPTVVDSAPSAGPAAWIGTQCGRTAMHGMFRPGPVAQSVCARALAQSRRSGRWRRPAVGFAPASGAEGVGSTGPGGTAFTAFQKQGWTDSARRGTRVRSERFPGHRPLASGSRFRRFSFPFSGRRIASSPTN